MSSDKNHSEDYKKYLKGEMSSQEANAFERSLLNDPFGHEAMEGLESQEPNQVFADIEELQKSVSHTSQKSFNWMRIAAVVALLLVSVFALLFTIDQTEMDSELVLEEKVSPSIQSDSLDNSSEIEDTKKLIAEAEVIEGPEVKTFKKDGQKVVEKIELSDEVAEYIETLEAKPVMTLAEADNPVEELTELKLDDSSIETTLQGKVAGVQIAETAPIVLTTPSIDSSELIAADLLTNSLVAQERSVASKRENAEDNTSRKTALRSQSSLPISAVSDNMTVSGTVTDDTGEALPGVNVFIKGTTSGTQTDLDGNFVLPKLDNMSLVFAFVGFESQEIQVGSRTTIDVSLGGATELQEVVVTGYSTSDKDPIPSFSPAKPTIGFRKYNKYLKENLQYPEQAKSNEIEGTVTLELTISPRGEITNIDIKKSLGYGCDEEAIRLVKEGSEWNAAKRDGINTKDTVKVKVKFKLDK